MASAFLTAFGDYFDTRIDFALPRAGSILHAITVFRLPLGHRLAYRQPRLAQ